MNKTTITLTDVVALVTGVVERFGASHTAASGSGAGCQYITQTSQKERLVPVCIVAQVFNDLGILRALMTDSGDQYEACLTESVLWNNAADFGVTFDYDARLFLLNAQQKQDKNGGTGTWGEALAYAMENAQEAALREFKNSNPLFTHLHSDVKAATYVPEPEPLAEWEKELLAGE